MRSLLVAILLLFAIGSADAAINLAISQQAGAAAQEKADQLARRLSGEVGTSVNVVVLPDASQVEAWLNRYATAELALVDAGYLAGKPGQFLVIGPVDANLTLIGRQGIAGDLPQKAAKVIGRRGEQRPAAREAATAPKAAPQLAEPAPAPAKPPAPATSYSSSKSASEDRYFVIQVYREKFGKDPEPERLDYWTEQLQGGVLSKRQFSEQVCQQGLALCKTSM